MIRIKGHKCFYVNHGYIFSYTRLLGIFLVEGILVSFICTRLSIDISGHDTVDGQLYAVKRIEIIDNTKEEVKDIMVQRQTLIEARS
jgi:hypothetical protein